MPRGLGRQAAAEVVVLGLDSDFFSAGFEDESDVEVVLELDEEGFSLADEAARESVR